VSDEAIELYKILKPLGDLEQYQFDDYRTQAVTLGGRNAVAAVYSKRGEAWILLGNLEDKPKTVRCTVAPEKLPNPFSLAVKAELVGGNKRMALDPRKLVTVGEEIRLPADDVVLLHLE
ncbi:MAG: hypothetical protein GY953_01855, partial [bacterium]|nr:hypothetical protein [bacterium]